jgi:hypothetical protein
MKTNHTMVATAVTLATIGLALSTPASAAVFIGFQSPTVNGGAITTEATGPTNATVTASYGVFSTNSIIGQDPPVPDILDSLAVDQINTAGSGTLNIYVTDTGLTGPLGSNLSFNSGLTVNELPSGWTLQERTFLDSNDGTYTTATPLANFTFSSIGTNVQLDNDSTGAGPYSVTEEYTIDAVGAGNASGTIDLSSAVSGVPEPAVWAMVLTGFFGVGYMMRGRRKTLSAAQA